ncbi:hypothetical protein SCHIN_v1c04950 [Spiroplasma chinense]|uniref:Uncharacterized protein n=1 Tax=Spiroplasma chinense TaxID=216932 RepID=A0A5B9Y6J0_9MOLU|nr:hypothetical protein [Spiroplasma chinense]QEH61692.1 hypothetical protein SCHIN_v1c04950 [Spiroplasma chinense]
MFGNSGSTTYIVIGIVVLILLVFVVVSSITSKKAQKKEQAKRKKVVRDEIKLFLAKTQNQKNITIDYEKVYARKGAEYKYRDVFDVVVQIIEPKTAQVKEVKAYEVEGITTRVDKKNYTTAWQVNKELDLEETKKRIAVAEKKIKLSKEERRLMKVEESSREKELKIQQKEEIKEIKAKKVEAKKDKSNRIDEAVKMTAVKFVPRRNK